MSQKKTNFFNVWADDYLEDYESQNIKGFAFRSRRLKVEKLLGKNLGKVMDIGCGPGIMANYVSPRCSIYCGIDLSENMIKKCVARFQSDNKINFGVGSIVCLPFADNSFDTIICMGVLEYLEKRNNALKEIGRVLKPNGLLIATLPNKFSPYRMWRRNFYLPMRQIYRKLKFQIRKKKFLEMDDIIHLEYAENAFWQQLKENGFNSRSTLYYNAQIIPSPFDIYFPRLDLNIAKFCEPLLATRLRWIGTGFIIKAIKK